MLTVYTYSLNMIFCFYIRWCVCVSFIQRHKVNGWVKLRYWQQVWQLHVKGVAMVTGHSQLSHPLPPSLCLSLTLSLSLTFFFAPSYSVSYQQTALYGRGGLVDAADESIGPEHSQTIINVQRHKISTSHSWWEGTSVGERRLFWHRAFVSWWLFFPSEHHNWGREKKKTKASPEQIITSWQEKLSCSAAEQGSCVSQTQMSHCFLPPCLTRSGHQVPLC